MIINDINNNQKIDEKPPQNRRQRGATDFTAVFRCQFSIIGLLFRTVADTILTSQLTYSFTTTGTTPATLIIADEAYVVSVVVYQK